MLAPPRAERNNPPVSDDDSPKRDVLGPYEGPSRAAPYPMSRMAPPFSLVDVAAEIARADEQVAQAAGGKLAVIAEQMRVLRAQAEALVKKAARDVELHRARCNFEKKPGETYHLYEKADGSRWFSRIAPDEWTPSDRFVGSYRLELDRSFTDLAELDETRHAEQVSAALPMLAGRPGQNT